MFVGIPTAAAISRNEHIRLRLVNGQCDHYQIAAP
eukprot:COSAG02_NODE_56731_length_284_cov_0.686486_1_plen_34_part_10